MADAVIRSLLHDPHYVSDEDTQASEGITPGHLVERGGSNDFQKHATAGGQANLYFADLEDAEGGAISDAYDSGDTLNVLRASPGDKLHARLGFGADEHNISVGDPLESNGDGTLRIHEPSFVGQATEVKVDSAGVQTFTIAHNRQNAPSKDEVFLTVVEEEDVDDYVLDSVKVTGISSGNIDGVVDVGTGSATGDASVQINAHIPPTGDKLAYADEAIDNSGASSESIIKITVA